MKTLKIRTVCNMAANAVMHFIADNKAKIGESGMTRVVEIVGIPEDVDVFAVISAWRQTADVTWRNTVDSRYPKHTYRYSEIGGGVILR